MAHLGNTIINGVLRVIGGEYVDTINGVTVTDSPKFTDTLYTANNGVGISGTTFYNSGVRAIATGTSNGTINVNTNGGTADVPVKGLAALAYKASLAKGDVGLGNVANLDQSKAIKSITRSGLTFTTTALDGTTSSFTQQDNNTTYAAGAGIALNSGTFSNSGVRSIATGTSNGTINVNTNGSTANVSVKGLGAMAYKASVSKSDVGLGSVANIDQSKAIKSITRSGLTFTATALDGTTSSFTQQDNNTTYAAGTGIALNSGTFSNSGVRAIAKSSSAGYINVNTNGSTANVEVNGAPKAVKNITRNGTTFTATCLDGSTFSFTQQGTSNDGVRSVTESTSNGNILVNTNGTTANVPIHGLGSAAYSNTAAFAANNHNHGTLNNDFTVTVSDTTVDSGWSMINSSYVGFLLKSIRFQASSPAWGVGNYGSGICFGGSDTKGVLSVGYGSPNIKFAGGNGTGPVWNMGLTGTSGKSYNLDNYVQTTGCTFTGNVTFNNGGIPLSSGKVADLTTGTSRIYSDGIVISNPATKDDVGFIRVTGTGESDTVLEICTGDDGGGGEQIVVRQYDTSNNVARQVTLLDTSGNSSFPGGVTINGDVSLGTISTGGRFISGLMGDNDYWRVGGRADSSDNGYLEIATADGGVEPIYVRQYSGVFSSLSHSITLMNSNGHQEFNGVYGQYFKTSTGYELGDGTPYIYSENGNINFRTGSGGTADQYANIRDLKAVQDHYFGRYAQSNGLVNALPAHLNNINYTSLYNGSGSSNGFPDEAWYFVLTMCHCNGAGWRTQYIFPMTGGTVRYRRCLGDSVTWTGWSQLLEGTLSGNTLNITM